MLATLENTPVNLDTVGVLDSLAPGGNLWRGADDLEDEDKFLGYLEKPDKTARALRRQYRKILMEKRKRIFYPAGSDYRPTPRWLGIISRTAKTCSCPMCGNPRRFSGQKTKQERISAIKLSEGLADAFSD